MFFKQNVSKNGVVRNELVIGKSFHQYETEDYENGRQFALEICKNAIYGKCFDKTAKIIGSHEVSPI